MFVPTFLSHKLVHSQAVLLTEVGDTSLVERDVDRAGLSVMVVCQDVHRL